MELRARKPIAQESGDRLSFQSPELSEGNSMARSVRDPVSRRKDRGPPRALEYTPAYMHIWWRGHKSK